MRRYSVVLCLVIAIGLLALSPQLGLTQEDNSACPALVKQALEAIGNNCGGLNRNTACYGFNRVDATFAQSVDDGFFSKPADQTQLSSLQSIQTAPLDSTLDQWGVAVMSVQANIPNTLPGQSVTFVLLGDTSIENAVPADAAFEPAETPLDLTTVVAANIRTRPSTNSNILGSVPSGATFSSDAISADSRWLRVVYNETAPGWISRDVIQTAGDLSTLPVLAQESKMPMQAFYFRTNIADTQCTEAPSLLVVQGPEKIGVDITANGADIHISSTIFLQQLPGQLMRVGVVHGGAKIGGVIIPAGFTVEVPLSEDGKSVAGPLMHLRPLTQEELDQLQTLNDFPTTILNYPIEVPTEDEIQQTLNALNTQSNPGSTTSTTTTGPASGDANCRNFRLTSPLDAWAYKSLTFYWDPAPGATSYRLNTSVGGTVETTGLNATIDFSTSRGTNLTWSVDALVNGQVACTAGPVSIPRDVSVLPRNCPSSGPCQ